MNSADLRSPLAKARDLWIEEQQGNIEKWSTESGVKSQYIQNRLERAFLYGANAQQGLIENLAAEMDH